MGHAPDQSTRSSALDASPLSSSYQDEPPECSQVRIDHGILDVVALWPALFPVEWPLVQSTWKVMSTPAQFAHLQMPAPFGDYALGPAYDEMFRANGRPRT